MSDQATSAADISLAADFETPSLEKWEKEVLKVLNRKRPEGKELSIEQAYQRLTSSTVDGLTIKPLYTEEDGTDNLGYPGVAPFVRGTTVRNGEIELGRTMQMFGWDTQIAASLALSIQDGDVLVDPTEIKAAGFDLTVDQLRPLLGEAAATLLDTHTLCVRDKLPAGITLTDIDLRANGEGGQATVTATLAPDLLSNPKQMQMGSCPTP